MAVEFTKPEWLLPPRCLKFNITLDTLVAWWQGTLVTCHYRWLYWGLGVSDT